MLDRLFAERRKHVLIESAAKSLCSGKPDALDFERFRLLQDYDLTRTQNLLQFFPATALIIVITENSDNWNPARAKIVHQALRLLRQAEICQITAQRQHVRILRNSVEQPLQVIDRGLMNMQVTDDGDTQAILPFAHLPLHLHLRNQAPLRLSHSRLHKTSCRGRLSFSAWAIRTDVAIAITIRAEANLESFLARRDK